MFEYVAIPQCSGVSCTHDDDMNPFVISRNPAYTWSGVDSQCVFDLKNWQYLSTNRDLDRISTLAQTIGVLLQTSALLPVFLVGCSLLMMLILTSRSVLGTHFKLSTRLCASISVISRQIIFLPISPLFRPQFPTKAL